MIIDFRTHKIPQIEKALLVLGSKTRIEIFKILSDGKEYNATDLSKKLGITVSSVCQQIDFLERSGFVERKIKKMSGYVVKIIEPIYDELLITFKSSS